MRGKRLSVDGNTVRHRLGSKSGSQAAGATRRPLPCASARGRRRRGRYVIKKQVRGTTSSIGVQKTN
ncbi:hypothetical protein U9M48_024379 [Paspalum notatum var. saurae]|uniref:Uncharacterized protein n=1 Tax=Paspalum notatum var. saurae TaxID=547442 RepID=A0AAQ3TQV6_PASNO